MTTKTERIRALNDRLRTSGIGGRILLTSGIAALPDHEMRQVIEAIQTFSEFDRSNDPYGEHDCAVLSVGGHRVIFKIDYYDKDMQSGSADPSDPAQTCRVLTIMLGAEY